MYYKRNSILAKTVFDFDQTCLFKPQYMYELACSVQTSLSCNSCISFEYLITAKYTLINTNNSFIF